MIKCNCGRKFATDKDWLCHFLILQPSMTIKNADEDKKLRQIHAEQHKKITKIQ